ncbi:class I SAM-dependent methyltransferase [Streptomyces sp. TRM68367]|uniref:class I SAM-dependent methyltransferase n=1 Tax=Streptomyces sp. TRM68367 TaxID=2758415 RepID=UPI002934505F|nr:class I SAM-dependent methyltransferase [Streptomyces sp. TRM68367]
MNRHRIMQQLNNRLVSHPYEQPQVTRHQFLQELHARLSPRNYLEIGVCNGQSLKLSRVPSIAIDPSPVIRSPLHCDLHLVKNTSDAFFGGPDPLGHLRSARNPLKNLRRGRPLLGRYTDGPTLDLAFIDGMHLFEYALRDFMNVERYCSWSSVVVFDDMLPRNPQEARRDRRTNAWTGDVFKMIPVLEQYRSDLITVQVNTEPTGLLLVLGLDPKNTVLRENYQSIIDEYVMPDPQKVPERILDRICAVNSEGLLKASFWKGLAHRRNRSRVLTRARQELEQIQGH